ncbi:Protein CBR-DAF-14 [Caenorhabditis briggsae]|uniref:Protein CBR-DAF-14 n=1 Tax=Caenorhabditis briggsae TaxID=6238 RepID=A8WXH4_CAEBR|nr:Protein CBR-DAF-14 [Caenorhabditis briggsae]CAP25118.1 Protein CBR-DAF-14 [Caenorhabditis briggsae]
MTPIVLLFRFPSHFLSLSKNRKYLNKSKLCSAAGNGDERESFYCSKSGSVPSEFLSQYYFTKIDLTDCCQKNDVEKKNGRAREACKTVGNIFRRSLTYHPSLNQDFNWAVPVNPMLPAKKFFSQFTKKRTERGGEQQGRISAPLPQSTMPSKHTEGMSSHQWWDDIPMPEDTPMMTRSIPGSSTEPSPQYDENHSVASVISQPGPSNPPMAPMTPGPVVITFERLNLNHSQPEPQPVLEEPECYCIEVNKPMPGVPQKLELRSDEVEMEEEEPEGGVTWCHVQTFQLGVKKKAQAKEVFQTSQPTFTIEGGITTVGSTSSRMQLTCGNSSKIQGIHQTFGEGIRMTKEKGTVWLTVLTAKCVVFIQSPFFNHINGKPLDTVIRVQNEHDELGNLLHEDKLPTIKLFDSELYASELNAARSDPINRMETMEAFCKTRVSLAKGFNGDYAKKIYDTQSCSTATSQVPKKSGRAPNTPEPEDHPPSTVF